MRRHACTVILALALAAPAGGCRKGGGEGAARDAAPAESLEAPAPQAKDLTGEIERLGKGKVDYLVVGVAAPSFAALSKDEKALAYWLSMAAIAGNDIMYLQNHRFALPIKGMLEEVWGATAGVPGLEEDREGLLDYLKYVWINHGPYDHRSSIKFVPNTLTRERLLALAAAAMKKGARLAFLPGATAEEKLGPLMPLIFDAEVEKRMTVTDKGVDVIAESHGNLYDPGITARDIEAVGGDWAKRLNVRFALVGGKVEPQVFSAQCTYGPAIKRIIGYLRKAVAAAPEGAFRESLHQLEQFYESGDEELFRKHSVTWIGLNGNVEYVNGFIEQLKDPRGVIGNFEGMSAVKADSAVVDRIGAEALYFEKKMPWSDAWKREKVDRATSTIVEVLTGTGDMGPVPWGGFNLPNYDDIRRDVGSKNVILLNILDAYSKKDRAKVVEEFYQPGERKTVAADYDRVRKLLVYLHEIIGHASGKADPSLKDDPRNIMGRNFSSLEECRADLVALYHAGDGKLVEIGLLEAGEVESFVGAFYLIYLTGHLIGVGSLEEPKVTEAHDRASQLVFEYLLAGGAIGAAKGKPKDYGVELVVDGGKHFVRITDPKKMHEGIGALLAELQAAKARGNIKAQDALFDALTLDPALWQELKSRSDKLDLAAQRVMVYPHLEPVLDASGAIVDVTMANDEDLVAQQLRFSKINAM
jgi:dipeptidyl-peptidase-3